MTPRERQMAVYAAEAAALDGMGRRFRTIIEAQAYTDSLTSSDWWLSRWPRVTRVAVHRWDSRRWAGAASARHREVLLAHRVVEATLLHELAHVVTPTDPGHGPEFVAALLQLVRECMGFHAYGALLCELRRAGLSPAEPQARGTA